MGLILAVAFSEGRGRTSLLWVWELSLFLHLQAFRVH